ncbi:acyl-CoA dehydrogenase [Azoarcus sp. CIB]|uniref:acyl-CoA dehydrogenase family protein n=1 Tax=Aromatoleum sp. (strain CIB) TaxID=198107 RepID=UPI00067E2F73|nr:acyl-CoA dehydrogenase family protein [Azoarcus sp. CIB]AKU12400.1 acyl-CoA dehydrogenase [Azoarcus sp. CIB]
MDFSLNEEQRAIEAAIGEICDVYDDNYWLRAENEKRFPQEFVDDLVKAGWMGVTMPQEYGGAGLGITEAAIIIKRISRLGANASSAVHINMFGPHPVVVFGTPEQKARFLPPLIEGKDRTCFGVTEPNVGLDTTHIKTFAERKGDRYVVNGSKVWISTAQIANKILLVTRTTKFEDSPRPTDGLTLFYTDMDRSKITVREIPKMGRNAVDSNELFIDGLEIPIEDRIGEEGKGFEYLLHGLNPERVLIAGTNIGAGQAVIDKAAKYAKERIVFGRPIGMNQGIQHPLADCWVRLQAAETMMFKAATLYDQGKPCGLEANMAKYLGGDAYFESAARAVRTHGGFGYAKEFHVERYYREAIMGLIGPVSHELVLCHIAERALGLPKSY